MGVGVVLEGPVAMRWRGRWGDDRGLVLMVSVHRMPSWMLGMLSGMSQMIRSGGDRRHPGISPVAELARLGQTIVYVSVATVARTRSDPIRRIVGRVGMIVQVAYGIFPVRIHNSHQW